MGDYGHMSNEDSANYICDVIGKKTKEIVLAHLSEEANSPEQAFDDWKKVFEMRGVDFNAYNIRCASQKDTVSGGK
jgi:phosphoribosyl 1,2-cyclic phosphodiesterase